jgi:tetratricopeptide (TPR) repeat protein/TolB-like protein
MQICEGLHEAHEAGVVHRDVKPGNIIVDTKGRARILDFGLAMVTGEEKLTKTGSTLGTVGYMAPEQVSGRPVDHRSDLFSVGVILYEMLTGRRPFEGDNDAAIVRAITNSDPEPVARFKSGVTGELQQIVDKALSKDRELRYQHADGMLADLKRLELGATAAKKSRTWLWAAVVVLAAIVGYFAIDQFALSDESTNGWDNSVAVLVFRNLSTNPDHDLFCEGMTDEIIGRLSTIKDLKVTSMQSMLRFKGTDLHLKEIGKELKVDNILEGNIQIVGDDIRVRAQLIRVDDDAHIWSDRFDRKITSIFDIQDEISRSIAGVLEATLIEPEGVFVSRRGTDDIEAYNEYVKGRHFWRKRTQEGLTEAIEHFKNAVTIDPNYAAGWAGLADGWYMLANYGYIDHLTGHSRADTASARALELDPNLAEAQTSRAMTLVGRTEYDEAEKHFLKAIELNPGYAWAHLWYSNVHAARGDAQAAFAEIQLAYELDPLSPAALGSLGNHYRFAGDVERAIEYFNAELEIEPSHEHTHRMLMEIYLDQRDTLKAMEIAHQLIERVPDNYKSYTCKAWLLWQLGRLDEAEQLYQHAIEVAPDLWAPYADYAWFLQDGRGDYAQAIEQDEKAIKLDSLRASVRVNYAHRLRLLGRMDESIEQSKKAIELAPYDPESYRAYGWAIGNGLHRYEEAIEYMERGLELNPRHTRTLNSISLMYATVGRIDDALAAINKSMEIAPGASFPNRRKADIFAQAGMFDSAAAWFRKYHELRPNDQRSIVMLGNLNTFMRKYDVADSIYGTVASNPDATRRAWGRGNTIRPLLHQGRISEALALLKAGIVTDSAELGESPPLMSKFFQCFRLNILYMDDPQGALEAIDRYSRSYAAVGGDNDYILAFIKGARAIAMSAMGEVEDAKRTVKELINAAGDNSDNYLEMLYSQLAEINRFGSDFETAAEWMRKAVEIRADYNSSLYLGVELVGAGKYAEAVDVLGSAILIYDGGRYNAPDESVICHYYLGRAYEGAGRTADAVAQYEIFLDIWQNADEGLESVEDATTRLARLTS